MTGSGADPAASLPEPPALDRPLGSLDVRLRRVIDDDFEVPGRRAFVTGTGTGGIEAVWTDAVRMVRGLGVAGATAREAMETPLGVERRLELDGAALVERVVASRDAPVAWVEWVAAERESGASRGASEGEERDRRGDRGRAPDDGPATLALEWCVSPTGDTGPPVLERDGRLLTVRRPDSGFRAVFILGAEPETVEVRVMEVEPAELAVRAVVPMPADGLRLAVLGIGADEDPARLVRIAGRTAVAVRGREGAVNRLLDDGLTVASPDPELDDAVARERVRLDASRLETRPEPWSVASAVAEARARLAVGDFSTVRGLLHRLVRVVDEAGRVPAPGAGDPLERRGEEAGRLFVRLVARYLAWSGDLTGVRAAWEPATRTAGALLGDPTAAPELEALAMAAEALGDDGWAARLRAAVGAGAAGGGTEHPGQPEHATASDAGADPIRTVVEGFLGAEPDAPRGRLVLRPRPPAGWDRLEVQGLAVGEARVDVAYRREGGLHRLTLTQTRGPAPLQVVLEPELPGERPAAARVDGERAELDAVAVSDRWRVPVQIVLDRPRTLEVEFTAGSP